MSAGMSQGKLNERGGHDRIRISEGNFDNPDDNMEGGTEKAKTGEENRGTIRRLLK